VTRGCRVGALVVTIALAALLGCSPGSDDVRRDAAATTVPADAAGTSPPVTTATTTTTTTTATTTTTTLPGPFVDEVLDVVEVSARFLSGDGAPDRLVAIAADGALAEVPLLDVADRSPVWCSAARSGLGSTGGAAEGFVVRVGPPGVDRSERGLERFELVSAALDPQAPEPGPVPATVRIDLDGEPLTTVDAVVMVADDPATGTFRGEFVGGAVIEGAFRCE
jgi:hypothetical protein